MSKQVAVRLFVICGLGLGVFACGGGNEAQSGATGQSAGGGSPQTSSQPQSTASPSSSQAQSGAQVGEAAKDGGKGVADAGKSLGKAVAGLGKSVGTTTADVATDAGITAAVNTRLKAEMPVDGIKASALTNDGVVTLKGSVPTAAAKSKAEQIAKSTSGVKRVVNQLEIK